MKSQFLTIEVLEKLKDAMPSIHQRHIGQLVQAKAIPSSSHLLRRKVVETARVQSPPPVRIFSGEAGGDCTRAGF